MSRKIELTRVHAINWYGYRDSLDMRGDVLIAGVTGSGKSILMDLVQHVLVADQRRTRYNQSATGERSTRDFIGYCLGNLKQDVGGASQFMRNSGITCIALEFTWPNRRRVETWGLRAEFESTLRREPSRLGPFFVPASLTRDQFLDSERRPLDFAAFRQLVEQTTDKDGRTGRIFSGVEEYRREMALPSHLNFDRGTLDYLLPAAMSFTFMDDFNGFCQRYILSAEELDIQSVKDSYLVFRSLQTELTYLHEQQTRLEKIQRLDQERAAADRDRVVTRYLDAEFRREHALDVWKQKQRAAEQIEQQLAEESKRLKQVEAEIEKLKQEIDRVNAVFNATEAGQLFLHLTNKNSTLSARIERLKQTGQTVQQAVQNRIRNALMWLQKVQALPFPVESAPLTAMRLAAEQLTKAAPEQFRERIRQLAQSVGAALEAVRLAAKPSSDRYNSVEREVQRHDAALAVLRLGMLPENTILLAELNKRLRRRGSDPPAQALWQLCEVKDERWRPALEVAFNRKFAVVVDIRDYDEAERIYHELRDEARGESLINPHQALKLSPEVKSGSLAEKIETSHPVARAILDHLFGEVICVERIHDLRGSPTGRAIMPDGFMAQRPFVQRPRHYDNRPCIGKRGLEKQRAWLQEQIELLRAQLRQLTPSLDAWRAAQTFAGDAKLESENVHDDLAEAERLPELQQLFDSNLKDLKLIRSTDLDEKQRELNNATNCLTKKQLERDNIIGSKRRHELQSLQSQSKEAEAEFDRRDDKFKQVAAGEDVSIHARRLEELRAEIGTVFPAKDAAADECQTQHTRLNAEAATKRVELVAERRALASNADYGMHYPPTDYEVESTNNVAYEKRLARIRDGEIPTYKEKATHEELNWQQLFRVQVLEKLREKLLEVENLMALLESQLKEPVGYNRYRIKAIPNRDDEYQLYRKLIDASAYAREGELLFASADAEVRELVEKLFNELIQPHETPRSLAFLDYRNYYDYDMLVEDIREPDQPPSSLNRHSGMFSGGENQAPFFVAILACYLRAYRRYERRRRDPSLALVPIDEAFSKLSGDCIRDCMDALEKLELQGVLSMSTGNIPYAIDHCDQVIAVHKQVTTNGKKKQVRNVAVTMTREAAYERFGRTRNVQ